MKFLKSMKVKKYRYDIFIKPLSLVNKIKVISKKLSSDMLNRTAPQSIEIGLTYKCQLSCAHCGVHGQQDPLAEEMSLSQIRDLIFQAGKIGIYTAVFSGGEPLTRPDICQCLEYAKKQAMITAVSTNAVSLNEDMIVKIKKAGINFINISFDSADADKHDFLRGRKGCFAKAADAVRLCSKHRIAAIVSTYATKDNIRSGQLKKIICLAKKLQARGVRILFSASAGRWFGSRENFFKDNDYLAVKSLLDPSFVYIDGICNKFTECNAVLKKLIYVSPYGDVQPCSFVPVSFGNIKVRKLNDICRDMYKHSFYSRFKADRCIMCSPEFFQFYKGNKNNQASLLTV